MRRDLPARLVLAAAFALLTAVCAQVTVPMVPVPMTLQTFAVLLAGAVLGPAWGAGAVILYLALGAVGLPVLSEGGSGLERFAGPTAGYLFAFPIAAALAGLLVRKPWALGLARTTAVLFGLHLLILALGAGWLATRLGVAGALAAGFTPFLIGAGVKSALVALTARVWPATGPFRRA